MLFLLFLFQDETLVERLKSPDLEVREAAAQELLKLDRPKLEKLKDHADAEVRARAKGAIDELDRRARVRAVRPEPVRLTLDLKDEPVESAVRQVFEPFGIEAKTTRFKDVRVTLSLKNATLWQAFDAFCAAAETRTHVSYFEGYRRWTFEPDERNVRPPAVHDAGDIRVALTPGPLVPDRTEHRGWRVTALLPHGTLPIGARLEKVRAFDASDREAACKTGLGPGGVLPSFCRRPGRVSSIWVEDLVAPDAARLEGTLLLVFAHDVERLEFALKDGVTKTLGETKVTLEDVIVEEGRLDANLEFEGASGQDERFVAWIEDSEGRRLGDASFVLVPRGAKWNESESACIEFDAKARAAKLVVARLIGADEVRVPFAIKEMKK